MIQGFCISYPAHHQVESRKKVVRWHLSTFQRAYFWIIYITYKIQRNKAMFGCSLCWRFAYISLAFLRQQHEPALPGTCTLCMHCRVHILRHKLRNTSLQIQLQALGFQLWYWHWRASRVPGAFSGYGGTSAPAGKWNCIMGIEYIQDVLNSYSSFQVSKR